MSVPATGVVNASPASGLQFFGMVKIDGDSKVLTVSQYNLAGEKLYSVDLTPE